MIISVNKSKYNIVFLIFKITQVNVELQFRIQQKLFFFRTEKFRCNNIYT